MDRCLSCDSPNMKKLGMRFLGKERGRGFKCNNCGETFVLPFESTEKLEVSNEDFEKNLQFIRDPEYIRDIWTRDSLVFVCAVNNSKVNERFLSALLEFCDKNNSKLVVLPIRYKNPSMLNDSEEVYYDSKIVPYLVENNFDLHGNIRVLGGIKVQATVDSPLSGIEGLSKGSSVIVPHPQLALRTLPRQTEKYPAIATTTGAITEKFYSNTKSGFKAGFNHSFSAVLVEYDDSDDHFIRHLNFDGAGFFDLGTYYGDSQFNEDNYIEDVWIEPGQRSVVALVTGDSHVMFHDSEVAQATFFASDSITKTLNPEVIVRHDVLDFFSRSHHSKNDWILNYAKHHEGKAGNIQTELEEVIEFINDTTPKDTKNVIVASNHNNHLKRWLLESDPKTDPENALLYHWLSYNVLKHTKIVDGTVVQTPDPFRLYCEGKMTRETVFLGESDSYKIMGIEVGLHGHVGVNGARGSAKAFSNVPMKTISAHQHTVNIDKGAYVVGTSSKFKLPYVKGLSSWDHAHCIIHANGKRQLIFIRNGKWRAK